MFHSILLPILVIIGLIIVIRAAVAAVQGRRERDSVLRFEKNDSAMLAAKAEAERTLPDFLAVLANPQGASHFAFHFLLGGWEFVWAGEAERRGEGLAGRIVNQPREPGYAMGDLVVVPLSDVCDWSYRDAKGVIQGQHTNRVVLGRLDPARAEEMRRHNGWEN